MVILAFICAAAAILVLLYYRKRVRNLKREIAHVHYTADPNSQPGKTLNNFGVNLYVYVIDCHCIHTAIWYELYFFVTELNLKPVTNYIIYK